MAADPAELVSRVRAALDDLERIALAAGERSRNWRAIGSGAVEHDGESPFPVVYDEGYPTEAEAEHIAANDPAAVLRLVGALRDIVDAYERARAATAAIGGTATYTAEVFAYESAVRSLAHGLGIDTEETP